MPAGRRPWLVLLARPCRGRVARLWPSGVQALGAAIAAALCGLLLAACGPAPQSGAPAGTPPSAAQEAMVDRQLFRPEFPSGSPGSGGLQGAPLGSPGAAPLGSGALFN